MNEVLGSGGRGKVLGTALGKRFKFEAVAVCANVYSVSTCRLARSAYRCVLRLFVFACVRIRRRCCLFFFVRGALVQSLVGLPPLRW